MLSSRQFCLFCIGVYLIAFYAHAEPAFVQSKLSITTEQQTHEFTIDIAHNQEAKSKGLMFKRSIAHNYGMLFLFDDTKPVRMWMRNTYISLDMIFANKFGEIIGIFKRARPLNDTIIPAPIGTYAVFEVQGGITSKKTIQIGDRLIHASFERM